MTSPEHGPATVSTEEIVALASGKAAEVVRRAIAALKQTRSYIEARIMGENLPFIVVSHLDQKGLKLYVELVPRKEFFELLEEELKKRRGPRTEEPETETRSTTDE